MINLSVCIPTYEMHGKGREYLEFSFNILFQQTFKEFEIIISDHSELNIIKDLCDSWKDKLNIKYFKNEYKRGNSSANINNAMRHASGKLIKILFQDDFLYDKYSLEKQLESFDKGWLAATSTHLTNGGIRRPITPSYHNDIHYGNNTLSTPSVIMFENNEIIEFDEELIWLMDVEYYKRLHDKFGLPTICNYISVVNRCHEYQITHTLATAEIKKNELKYVINKYKT